MSDLIKLRYLVTQQLKYGNFGAVECIRSCILYSVTVSI